MPNTTRNNSIVSWSHWTIQGVIVSQSDDDPAMVRIHWGDGSPAAIVLDSLWEKHEDWRAPALISGVEKVWRGLIWNDAVDEQMKAVATALLEIRFSNPDRTSLVLPTQAQIWPESFDDEQHRA